MPCRFAACANAFLRRRAKDALDALECCIELRRIVGTHHTLARGQRNRLQDAWKYDFGSDFARVFVQPC